MNVNVKLDGRYVTFGSMQEFYQYVKGSTKVFSIYKVGNIKTKAIKLLSDKERVLAYVDRELDTAVRDKRFFGGLGFDGLKGVSIFSSHPDAIALSAWSLGIMSDVGAKLKEAEGGKLDLDTLDLTSLITKVP